MLLKQTPSFSFLRDFRKNEKESLEKAIEKLGFKFEGTFFIPNIDSLKSKEDELNKLLNDIRNEINEKIALSAENTTHLKRKVFEKIYTSELKLVSLIDTKLQSLSIQGSIEKEFKLIYDYEFLKNTSNFKDVEFF